MNDRELTELAAKAAGYVGEWKYLEAYAGRTAGWYFVLADHTIFNPLVDGGDALQLAVTLGFINPGCFPNVAMEMERLLAYNTPDWQVATRQAIVRAAAEIGWTVHSL